MRTAVLVIDVQQGLCEGEGKAFDCEGLINRINLVTSKARAAGAPGPGRAGARRPPPRCAG